MREIAVTPCSTASLTAVRVRCRLMSSPFVQNGGSTMRMVWVVLFAECMKYEGPNLDTTASTATPLLF